MESIIVTVKRAGELQEYDLAVRPDVPISQISAFISNGFGWNAAPNNGEVNYVIEVIPPGKKLPAHETLEDADVGDGARLVFHPVSVLTEEQVNNLRKVILNNNPEQQPPSGTPFVGHRSLSKPETNNESTPDYSKNSYGYVFKQIDDDS